MVVEEWSPGVKVDIDTAISARRWALLMTVTALIGPILIATLLIGMAITGGGYTEHPLLTAVMILLITDASVTLLALGLMVRAEKREGLSGYTTTRAHLELPEVDDSTGHVVRMPGEKGLSREERSRRIREINRVLAGES